MIPSLIWFSFQFNLFDQENQLKSFQMPQKTLPTSSLKVLSFRAFVCADFLSSSSPQLSPTSQLFSKIQIVMLTKSLFRCFTFNVSKYFFLIILFRELQFHLSTLNTQYELLRSAAFPAIYLARKLALATSTNHSHRIAATLCCRISITCEINATQLQRTWATARQKPKKLFSSRSMDDRRRSWEATWRRFRRQWDKTWPTSATLGS